MSTRPLPRGSVSLAGSADAVEAEFYEALQQGDIERMMAVWADDDDIVCVHPGGGRAIGAAQVRGAFEAMFASGGGVALRPTRVHRLRHLGSEVHHLVEQLEVRGPRGVETAYVLATNVFVQTAQGWRLVAHHASPAVTREPPAVHPAAEPPPSGLTLH